MKIHCRILFQDLSLTTVGYNRRHAVLRTLVVELCGGKLW